MNPHVPRLIVFGVAEGICALIAVFAYINGYNEVAIGGLVMFIVLSGLTMSTVSAMSRHKRR